MFGLRVCSAHHPQKILRSSVALDLKSYVCMKVKSRGFLFQDRFNSRPSVRDRWMEKIVSFRD